MMSGLREQWLILLSTPIYLIIIGLELLLSNVHLLHLYSKKGVLANVYLMLLNAGLDLATRALAYGVLGWFFLHQVYQWHAHGALYWLCLVLLLDCAYYWLHRFDHQIRFFWATHVTHHSSTEFNFSVGFRSSVFQPLYRFIYFIPLALVGFEVMDIAFVYSATQIWGILVHTKLVGKLGWLEHVLVTPSHHRVHHASNPLYLDKNMGMFLIVWDKLFGTFQAELPVTDYEPIRYGLTTNLSDTRLPNLVTHEWKSIWKDASQPRLAFRQRWQYIFGLPGYSHDGSRQTSEQMRAQENICVQPEEKLTPLGAFESERMERVAV